MTPRTSCCIVWLLCAGIGLGQNIVRNGAAELGTAVAGGAVHQIPDWVPTTSTPPTAVLYSAISGSFPRVTDPGVVNPGRKFFAGGPSALMSSMQNTHDLSSGAALIDTGTVNYTLSADLGGFATDGDNARAFAVFFDVNFSSLGSSLTIGPVTPAQRGNVTGFIHRSATGPVPVGTRAVVVIVDFMRMNGSYCDGYADNIALVLNPDPLVHPVPNGGPCGSGTVGATAGYLPFDVLQVEFSAGDAHRQVTEAVGQNIGLALRSPYPGSFPPFAVFALVDNGTYTQSDVTSLGAIGTMCLPIFSSDPRAFILSDNVGLGGLLGPNAIGTTIFGGLPVPASLVIQAIFVTPTGGFAITNAVHLTVQ